MVRTQVANQCGVHSLLLVNQVPSMKGVGKFTIVDPPLNLPPQWKYTSLQWDCVAFSPPQMEINQCIILAGESGASNLALLPTLIMHVSQYKCIHCVH